MPRDSRPEVETNGSSIVGTPPTTANCALRLTSTAPPSPATAPEPPIATPAKALSDAAEPPSPPPPPTDCANSASEPKPFVISAPLRLIVTAPALPPLAPLPPTVSSTPPVVPPLPPPPPIDWA